MTKPARIAGVVLVVAATVGAGDRGPRPFHEDAAAVERAVLDATLALLRENAAEARAALDRIEAGCRRVARDEEPPVPGELVAWDRGFHQALDESREFAARGEIERSFDKLAWIQRACRGCHAQAIKDGIRSPSP